MMVRTNPPQPVLRTNDKELVRSFQKRATAIMNSTVLQSRSALGAKLGKSFDGKRDLYNALGYPQLDAITFDDYYGKYRRQDIAGRLIDAPVEGSWEQKPVMVVPGDDDSEFVKEWDALVKQLSIWNRFIRGDKLTRIGRFGGILIGFDDVKISADLKNEVEKGEGRKILFVQPYGEGNLEVAKLYSDLTNPKFGYPEIYRLKQSQATTGSSNVTQDLEVHESRIIHLAEGLLESNVYGLPALERTYNRLLNLELIVGGSAEMFWQGAFPGYAFIADDDADMTQASSDLEEEIDLFVHDLKRYMKLQGLKVENLSPDVADPSKHLEAQLTMVSIGEGIPMRILTGSERGQLASGQDESHWNDKLNSRRIDYIEPTMLRPLVNRCIEYGVLTDPGEGGYTFVWPDLNAPTDKDKAEVAKIRADALKAFASAPELNMMMTFESFMLEILKLDKDTVDRIVDAGENELRDNLNSEEDT